MVNQAQLQLNEEWSMFSADHSIESAGNPERGSSPRDAGQGMAWFLSEEGGSICMSSYNIERSGWKFQRWKPVRYYSFLRSCMALHTGLKLLAEV
jgi:hypothetical protein